MRNIFSQTVFCNSYVQFPLNTTSSCLLSHIPDTVEDISNWVNSDVKIGLDYFMKLTLFFISEEGVRHPNSTWIRHGQIFDAACNLKNIYLFQIVFNMKIFQKYIYHIVVVKKSFMVNYLMWPVIDKNEKEMSFSCLLSHHHRLFL